MSENTNIEDLNWFENSVKNGHIKSYEYLNFKNIHQIGNGKFGSVSRANYKNSDLFFALKSFNDDQQALKEVVKEVKY